MFQRNVHFTVTFSRIASLAVLLLAISAFGASTPVDTTVRVVETKRSMAVSILAWPFERVLQPTFSTLMYPITPPLKYIARQKVIERSMDLITLGEKGNVMLYPTFNLKPGSQTMLGLTYRHRNLFSPNHDKFYGSYSRFINSDWDFRTQYNLKNLFGTELKGWIAGRYREDRDQTFNVDEFSDVPYQYTDSSWEVRAAISNPLSKKWEWEYRLGIEHKKFGEPIADVPLMPCAEFGGCGDSLEIFNYSDRGFYQHFWQFPLEIILRYSTKNNDHATTTGQAFRAGWSYVPVTKYKDPMDPNATNHFELGHDYFVLNAVYQRFFLVGKTRYALSRKESKANQKFIQQMSLDKSMELFSPEQLRTTLLERKVIALQIRMRQFWEVDHGGAPFVAYSEMNANTPLRGYDNRFFGKGLLAGSLEYRWPILDMVDGVVFNEYGVVGDSWYKPEVDRLRNSWGFGIRVRRPDLFISRLQVGFHGLQGINIIMTTNPEF